METNPQTTLKKKLENHCSYARIRLTLHSVSVVLFITVVLMIEVGQRKKARYWGNFTVKKVAKLRSPVLCYSKEIGEVEFMPTIVQIEWDVSPSSDKNEFWFPYWVKIRGKEKYGQFAPMVGKNGLLLLLKEAIRQDFFAREFLKELAESIQSKLDKL